MCEVRFDVCPRCARFHRVRMTYCAGMQKILRKKEGDKSEWTIRSGFCWSPMGGCEALSVSWAGRLVHCPQHAGPGTATTAEQRARLEEMGRQIEEYVRELQHLDFGESSGESTEREADEESLGVPSFSEQAEIE